MDFRTLVPDGSYLRQKASRGGVERSFAVSPRQSGCVARNSLGGATRDSAPVPARHTASFSPERKRFPFVAPRQVDLRASFVSSRGSSRCPREFRGSAGSKNVCRTISCPSLETRAKRSPELGRTQEILRIILPLLPYATRGRGRGNLRRTPPAELPVETKF